MTSPDQDHAAPAPGPESVRVDSVGAARRSNRRSLAIIVGAVAALGLVVGAVALVLYLQVFSKLDGSDSPQGAVQQLLDGISAHDMTAVGGSFAPDERYDLSDWDALQETWSGLDLGLDIDLADYESLQEDLWKAVTISFADVAFRETTLDTGLVMVEAVGGTVSVDIDGEQLADAVAQLYQMLEPSLGDAEIAQMRSDIIMTADAELPLEWQISAIPALDGYGPEFYPFLMTVELDGAWYVSAFMSIGEYVTQFAGEHPRGSMPTQYAVFASPEAAGEAFLDGLTQTLRHGSVLPVASTVSSAEQRLLAVYGPVLGTFDPIPDFSISDVRFTSTHLPGDRVSLTLDQAAVQFPEGQITYANGCVTFVDLYGGADTQCLADIPDMAQLGITETSHLVAVRQGDGWAVSIGATFIHSFAQYFSQIMEMGGGFAPGSVPGA